MHSKGNHQQNEKTTYWMEEKVCKWNAWQEINSQQIETTCTTPNQRNKQYD